MIRQRQNPLSVLCSEITGWVPRQMNHELQGLKAEAGITGIMVLLCRISRTIIKDNGEQGAS